MESGARRVAMTAGTYTPPHLAETPASVRVALAFERSDRLLNRQGGLRADVNKAAGAGPVGQQVKRGLTGFGVLPPSTEI
jgi:hypothetical protein